MLLYKNRSSASRLFCSNIKQTSDVHLHKSLTQREDERGVFTNLTNVQIGLTACSIPSSFGRNGDKSNSAFVIRGVEACDEMDITIFNRNGKEVFRDKSYKNDWEGQGLDEGVYYYLISVKNGRKADHYRGWVLLIRS